MSPARAGSRNARRGLQLCDRPAASRDPVFRNGSGDLRGAGIRLSREHRTSAAERIEVVSGDGAGSTYEALSADARRAHGLAPSLWVYDELAQAKDRELLDGLMTSMGKRARSLGIVISTQAPRGDHPLSQLIDDGLTGADPGIYVKLISAPDDAAPFNADVIRACNPAAGHFLSFDELLSQAKQAKRMPAFEAKFRNLRLNQRISQDAGFVSPLVWVACGAEPLQAAFESAPVYIGLDLSARSDLTAWCMPRSTKTSGMCAASSTRRRRAYKNAQCVTGRRMTYGRARIHHVVPRLLGRLRDRRETPGRAVRRLRRREYRV